MKKLNVEIKGIGFPNKGAELMLSAITHQFAERGVAARFAVEPYGDYVLRAKHGLFQKARVTKFGVNIGAIVGLLPKKLLNVFGIIPAKDIDVVLDASGFSYGDQWGPSLVDYRLGSTIADLKKRGVKVVLLPQAFGPFEQADTKESARNILSQSDLVFARDPKSLMYCQPLVDNTALELCPDFTNLVSGVAYHLFDSEKHEVCFIPNSKMLEKTCNGDDYIELMVSLIQCVEKKGKKAFLLVHEGSSDRKLAEDILNRSGCDIEILEPIDPLKIKWVIGNSLVVVSSRFHGLVSALSQGVPVVATGWSHKYQCLLEDYGVSEALIDVVHDKSIAEKYLSELLSNKEFYRGLSNKIKQNGVKQKEQVRGMWDKVFSCIKEN